MNFNQMSISPCYLGLNPCQKGEGVFNFSNELVDIKISRHQNWRTENINRKPNGEVIELKLNIL